MNENLQSENKIEETNINSSYQQNENNTTNEIANLEKKHNKKQKALYTTFDICIIAICTAILAVSAFLKIPFVPVPFTLQTLVCLMIGGLLGKWRALICVGLYLFLGLIGIPIFTNGGGFAYVLQPTFGYLIAMLVGSFFVGFFTEKPCKYIKIFLVCLITTLIMTLLGSIYMFVILRTVNHLEKGFFECIYSGFVLFVLPEILKSILAALLIYKLKPILLKIDNKYL